VDVVIEGPGGEVVGVEVKASASVGAREFDGLKAFAEVAGRKFVRGVVFISASRTSVRRFAAAVLASRLGALTKIARGPGIIV
jgi:hypothetical protein